MMDKFESFCDLRDQFSQSAIKPPSDQAIATLVLAETIDAAMGSIFEICDERLKDLETLIARIAVAAEAGTDDLPPDVIAKIKGASNE